MGGLAADMGAGQRKIFAQEMHQQRARFDEAFDLGAVHLHGHMSLSHSWFSLVPLVRSSQRISDLILRSVAKAMRLEGWLRVTTAPAAILRDARKGRAPQDEVGDC